MDGARLLQCTRLIQHGTKCSGNLCRHRRQCPQPDIGRLTVEHKSACGRPLRGGKLQRQRSVRSVRFFSLTRAVKGDTNSPWTVRTTPAVSVHVRVIFRRGRGICGCIELICYQITKAPADSGGGLVLFGPPSVATQRRRTTCSNRTSRPLRASPKTHSRP